MSEYAVRQVSLHYMDPEEDGGQMKITDILI